MGLAEWLKEFRELHGQAKRKELARPDLAGYHAARDELARALLAAQHVALQPGQKPRRVLRVSRALQADLEFVDGSVRAMTLEVGAGGFAALLAKPPRANEELKVSLRVPGGEPLRADARVVDVKAQPGNARACFQFVGLGEDDVERLEMFAFDAVLEQLQK
jgi:PilZ domain-containing protein